MKQIINKLLHRVKVNSLEKKEDLQDRSLVYKSWNDIKTILLFWVAEPGKENFVARDLLQQLKKSQMKVDSLCFVMKGAEILQTDDMVYVQNEDLGFGGKIQNNRLLEMLAVQYDLLIDLSQDSNSMMDYILRNSRAMCKVGMKKEGFEADIIIDGANTLEDFVQKLVPVLSGLKSYRVS